MEKRIRKPRKILREYKELIVISSNLYEFFMAHDKEGMVAKAVYEHLIYTAHKQKTNQPKANPKYISNGTKIGIRSVEKAMTFLKRHDIISYIQAKPTKEHPYWGKGYVRLNYLYKQETLVKMLKEQEKQISSYKTKGADEGTDDKRSAPMKSAIAETKGTNSYNKQRNALNKKEEYIYPPASEKKTPAKRKASEISFLEEMNKYLPSLFEMEGKGVTFELPGVKSIFTSCKKDKVENVLEYAKYVAKENLKLFGTGEENTGEEPYNPVGIIFNDIVVHKSYLKRWLSSSQETFQEVEKDEQVGRD